MPVGRPLLVPAYHKWLRRHVIFDIPLSTRQREIYLFMLSFIMGQYQRYSNKFYFEDVEYIRVKQELDHKEHMAGTATRTHVELVYHDHMGIDSLMAAHELLHTLFFNLFEGIDNGKRDAINLVHFADNVGPPYVINRTLKYLSYKDRLMRKKAEPVRVFYFDLPLVLGERERVRELVKSGKAPEGPNEYVQY